MTDINKEQENIINSIDSVSSGRLIIPPRFGKTKIIINIIDRDKPKNILWVTPSKSLKNKTLPKELENWSVNDNNIKFITWSSLKNEEGHYSLVVLDEEQRITEMSLNSIRDKRLTFDRLLSMTGTKTEDLDKENLFKNLNLGILFEMSIDDGINKGVLSNIDINIVNIKYDFKDYALNQMIKSNESIGYYTINDNTLTIHHKESFKTFALKKSKTKKGDDIYLIKTELQCFGYIMSDFKSGKLDFKGGYLLRDGNLFSNTYNNLDFYLKIQSNRQKKEVFKKYVNNQSTGRNLIFSNSIKDSEDLGFPTYNSKTNETNLNLFNNYSIDTLSMVNSGGTGFTFTNVNNIFIQQCSSNRNGDITQKLGRGLINDGTKTVVWLFKLSVNKDEEWVSNVVSRFKNAKITEFYEN